MAKNLAQVKQTISGFTFFKKKKANSVLKLLLPKAKASAGFTLIELLIAVTLIVIISAVGIAGFNSASRISGIKQSAQELKTLARKLRTDAGAATKPSSCAAASSVYGSYINFQQNSTTVTYGLVCGDPPSGSPGSTQATTITKQLSQGLRVGNVANNNLTVFYSFDGGVRFFQFAGAKTSPTRDDINNVPSIPVSDITALNDTISVVVTNSASVVAANSGNSYYLHFNQNGLVCEQRYPTNSCAQ